MVPKVSFPSLLFNMASFAFSTGTLNLFCFILKDKKGIFAECIRYRQPRLIAEVDNTSLDVFSGNTSKFTRQRILIGLSQCVAS